MFIVCLGVSRIRNVSEQILYKGITEKTYALLQHSVNKIFMCCFSDNKIYT